MSAIFPVLMLLTEPLQDSSPPEASGLPGLDMTRYALVCLGLVVGILLLGWGFKRVLAGNLRMRAGQRSMKVVDVLPLGSKRQLAVVRCYDRTFVLGLGEREVNLVTELDVDEDVEGRLVERGAEPRVQPEPKQGQSGGFGGLLESAMSRWSPKGNDGSGGNPETRPSRSEARIHREVVDRVELTPAVPKNKEVAPTATPTQEPGSGGSLGGGLYG